PPRQTPVRLPTMLRRKSRRISPTHIGWLESQKPQLALRITSKHASGVLVRQPPPAATQQLSRNYQLTGSSIALVSPDIEPTEEPRPTSHLTTATIVAITIRGDEMAD